MAFRSHPHLDQRNFRPDMANPVGSNSQLKSLREFLMISRVNGSSIPTSCSRVGMDVSNDCPSSEWYAIQDYLSAAKQSPPPSYIDRFGFSEGLQPSQLHGENAVRQLAVREDESFIGYGPRPMLATTEQAVVSDALATTGALWSLCLTNVTARTGHGSALSDQSDAAHSIAKNYSQPYSTAVCVPGPKGNVSYSEHVALPILVNSNPPELANGNLTYQGHASKHVADTIEHPDFFYHQLLDAPGSINEYRLRWIELPEDLFSGSSIGAAILLPGTQGQPQPDLLLCNVAVGWGPASITVETRDGGLGSVTGRMNKDNIANSQDNVPIGLTNIPAAESQADVYDYFEFHYPQNPKQLINISET